MPPLLLLNSLRSGTGKSFSPLCELKYLVIRVYEQHSTAEVIDEGETHSASDTRTSASRVPFEIAAVLLKCCFHSEDCAQRNKESKG
jgi:hypothetical protein